jgi:DNA-binding NtrC family response regulator
MSDPQSAPKPVILLVDDEPDILQSLKRLLRHDFQVHIAESAQEALKILEEEPIHVVMTDQRMPEMTGSELLTSIRDAEPDPIRIVFTGYADLKSMVNAVNSGQLFRYITKPWDPDELIETLHEAASAFAQRQRHRKLMQDACRFFDRYLDASEPADAAATALQEDAQTIRTRMQHELGTATTAEGGA